MFSAFLFAPLLLARLDDPAQTARASEAAKDFTHAAEAWERVAAGNPTDWTSFVSAANDRYQAKEYRAAITLYEKADRLGGPLKFDMPYSIASCYGLLGDKEAAFAHLKQAMDLGYRDVAGARTDADLNLLHGDKRFDALLGITDFSHFSRNEGLRYDLQFLARELQRMHYSPYRRFSKAAIDSYVGKLDREIPKLDDEQVYVRFKALGAMMGDGHTHVTTPYELAASKKSIPVSFTRFEEGVFVTGADSAHTPLLGQRLVALDGVPVEEAAHRLEPIISWDNAMNFKARIPEAMRLPALLYGQGIAKKAGEVTLSLESGDVKLVADSAPDMNWKAAREVGGKPTPLTYQHRDKPYWFTYLAAEKTVYFAYNAVRNDPAQSLAAFVERLFDFVDRHDIQKLVLDMRWNGGGNNFLNQPLLLGLISNKKINQAGKLFVIEGRSTFSAAVCGITQIQRYTNATFVGEPCGSSPNFIGESIPIALPYSKLNGTVSDLYWQNSHALDTRIWIAPDLYTPPTFADYRVNRDAALDAILGHNAPVTGSDVTLPGG